VQDSLPQIQFPAQLVLYAIPCAVYAVVQRLRGRAWSQIASNLGLRRSQPVYYIWALVFFVVLGLLSLVTISAFFPGYYDRPGIAASQYAGVELGILAVVYAFFREAVYVALGEELFFRGLVGGWLMRRWGFWVGNALQSLVFWISGHYCWHRSFPGGCTADCCTTRGASAGMVGAQFSHRPRCRGRDELRGYQNV
jgi:membrane protease YdiL (CAAX protease family)